MHSICIMLLTQLFLLAFLNLKAKNMKVEGVDVEQCFKGNISIQNLLSLLHPVQEATVSDPL